MARRLTTCSTRRRGRGRRRASPAAKQYISRLTPTQESQPSGTERSVEELQEVVLHLADAPAQGGQLDRSHHAVEVGERLRDADDPPLQRAERFPEAQCVTIDGHASHRFV